MRPLDYLAASIPPARQLVRMHLGETPIAEIREWVLVARDPQTWRAPWVSLRLAWPAPEIGRRSFWLGACPERMARLKDWTDLRRGPPEVARWAEKQALAHARAVTQLNDENVCATSTCVHLMRFCRAYPSGASATSSVGHRRGFLSDALRLSQLALDVGTS